MIKNELFSDSNRLTVALSTGRLEYETQTRQAAGTTNLYKTQYAYSYIAAASGGGRQLVRTEQSYSGGAWVNDNKLTYQHDALGRQTYEERHDWASGAWSSCYDTTQTRPPSGGGSPPIQVKLPPPLERAGLMTGAPTRTVGRTESRYPPLTWINVE